MQDLRYEVNRGDLSNAHNPTKVDPMVALQCFEYVFRFEIILVRHAMKFYS